jgi:hypothetical protein
MHIIIPAKHFVIPAKLVLSTVEGAGIQTYKNQRLSDIVGRALAHQVHQSPLSVQSSPIFPPNLRKVVP